VRVAVGGTGGAREHAGAVDADAGRARLGGAGLAARSAVIRVHVGVESRSRALRQLARALEHAGAVAAHLARRAGLAARSAVRRIAVEVDARSVGHGLARGAGELAASVDADHSARARRAALSAVRAVGARVGAPSVARAL